MGWAGCALCEALCTAAPILKPFEVKALTDSWPKMAVRATSNLKGEAGEGTMAQEHFTESGLQVPALCVEWVVATRKVHQAGRMYAVAWADSKTLKT